jgi:hypothetical protein
MVFNATFNNIPVISWRSVIFVEEAGGPGENIKVIGSSAISYQPRDIHTIYWDIATYKRKVHSDEIEIISVVAKLIRIRIRIRKLYFDSAHNKTVQHPDLLSGSVEIITSKCLRSPP